jgi:hypothetical protein
MKLSFYACIIGIAQLNSVATKITNIVAEALSANQYRMWTVLYLFILAVQA